MTFFVVALVAACSLTWLLFPLMSIASFADRGRKSAAVVAGVLGYSVPLGVALIGADRQVEGFWPAFVGGLVWPAVGVNVLLIVLARAMGRDRRGQ